MIHSFVLHRIKLVFVVLETLSLKVPDSRFLYHVVLPLKMMTNFCKGFL